MGDRSRRMNPHDHFRGGPLNIDDDDVTLYSLKKLLVTLQTSFDAHKEEIKKKLDEHKADFKKRIDKQSKDLQKSINEKIETEVKNLTKYIDQEIGTMVTRLEHVETRMKKLEEKQEQSEVFSYDTTVIISNLAVELNEDLPKKVDNLIKDGLRLHGIKFLRVLRLQSRNTKPGLVKVQLHSLEDKVKLLRAKQHLSQSEVYKKVFMRSSKSHAERVAEFNMKTLMATLPGLNKDYRLTGNGKLIPKSEIQPQKSHTPINNGTFGPTTSFGPHGPPGQFSTPNPVFNHHQLTYSPYDEIPSVYLSRNHPPH